MKTELNPDESFVEKMRLALNVTDGYCPCKVERTEDTKCPCKEFREQTEPGECQCGLYVKHEG